MVKIKKLDIIDALASLEMSMNDENLFEVGVGAAERIFAKGEDKNADINK